MLHSGGVPLPEELCDEVPEPDDWPEDDWLDPDDPCVDEEPDDAADDDPDDALLGLQRTYKMLAGPLLEEEDDALLPEDELLLLGEPLLEELLPEGF